MINIKTLVFGGLAILLSACAQTSAVMLDSAKSYSPTTNVEILSAAPDRAYKSIALLESSGPVGTTLPDLLENMRKKGMTIGADAVIPVEDASRDVPQGLMWNPWLGGYQTIGGGRAPIIRGVAIKYVTE